MLCISLEFRHCRPLKISDGGCQCLHAGVGEGRVERASTDVHACTVPPKPKLYLLSLLSSSVIVPISPPCRHPRSSRDCHWRIKGVILALCARVQQVLRSCLTEPVTTTRRYIHCHTYPLVLLVRAELCPLSSACLRMLEMLDYVMGK